MNFDAAAMAKRARSTRKKVILLREIVPTAALASDLAAIYLRVVRAWQGSLPAIGAEYARTLAGLPMRDSVSETESFFTSLTNAINSLILSVTVDVEAWALQLERWHERKWGAALLPSGVDVRTLIGPEDVRETLDVVTARNVALVRNVSDEARARIADIVFRGFQARTPARDIAREMNEAVGLGRRRALSIASDQTVKLSAALDRERQQQAGLEKFKWRSSHKRHFRPEHQARDGKIYEWSNAPSDLPGTLPYCGCRAQGVLSLD